MSQPVVEDRISRPTGRRRDLLVPALVRAAAPLVPCTGSSPGSAYNVPLPRRLRGALDVGALERALTEIVARHETLRTTFARERRGPVPARAPAPGGGTASSSTSASSPTAESEMDAPRSRSRRWRRSISPPGRCVGRVLLRLATAGTTSSSFTLHHIVTDGWSVTSSSASSPPTTPRHAARRPPPAGAARPIRRLRRLAARPAHPSRRAAGPLAPAARRRTPVLDLPTDHPRPAIQTFPAAPAPPTYPPGSPNASTTSPTPTTPPST